MVLLSRTSLDAALAIGEHIRAATAGTTFVGETGRKVSIAVSIGISQFGSDGDTINAPSSYRRPAPLPRGASWPQLCDGYIAGEYACKDGRADEIKQQVARSTGFATQ